MRASRRTTAAFALTVLGLLSSSTKALAAIEPARAWVPRQALEDALRAFLPIHVQHTGDTRLALVDGMYAGAGSGELGTFLGVLTPGPQSQSHVLFDRADTSASVQQILDRAEKTLPQVPWLAVVTIQAGWTDGTFKLTTRDVLGLRAVAAGSTNPAPNTLVERTVFAIETRSLIVPGGTTPLRLSIGGRFFGTGAHLSITPAAELHLSVGTAPSPTAPTSQNGQVLLPYSFVNWVRSHSLGNGPLALGSGATSVQVTGLTASHDNDALVLVGTAPGPAESTWKVEARFSGADAGLSAFSITNISCGNLSPIECLAEKARRALFAGTLLGVYQGLRLHSMQPQLVSILIAGINVQLLLDIRRVSASSEGIHVDVTAWRSQQ